ncbi:hypothetical protein K402DRAFT_395003 [Aulographum hederae CBS 113979]|uniref:DNA-directed RNA polymerase subunit n=1 Tax=Aulographum hederae CBS 113979 TaxID=1176131 RepID=A0A6G1GX28_9PEZI|nr:hypothetical protein K402DRAFT_395003 [Aulographum hederae CBS 113979]
MLLFCPTCANMLTISKFPDTPNRNDQKYIGMNRFECRTCPYQYILERQYYERKEMKAKEVEDVVGGSQQWENSDKMQAQCPNEKCDGDMAFFYQLQIRSADEPMTTFYKCTKCKREWRE